MCTCDTDVKLCDLQHMNTICYQPFSFTVIAQFIEHQESLTCNQDYHFTHKNLSVVVPGWKGDEQHCATVVGFLCARIGNNNVWQQGEC